MTVTVNPKADDHGETLVVMWFTENTQEEEVEVAWPFDWPIYDQ